jgi:RimJ/RimL family protein N-acetyltransferase
MSYGEKVLRLTPVIALAMPANTGSTGVLAKLDFSFVGPVTVMGIPALKYMKKIDNV